jgi:hypothetical protein
MDWTDQMFNDISLVLDNYEDVHASISMMSEHMAFSEFSNAIADIYYQAVHSVLELPSDTAAESLGKDLIANVMLNLGVGVFDRIAGTWTNFE